MDTLLAEIEKLCPDTYWTLYNRWSDVVRSAFGDPGEEIVAECVADLQDALDGLQEGRLT